MPARDRPSEQVVRETAYFIWEREGRPDGRDWDHWLRAAAGVRARHDHEDAEPMEDEEKILAGRHDVNLPALLTKDVPGG
jgi:Protein of unknown function (DUF2934)